MKSLAIFLLALFVFSSASAEKVDKMPAPKGYVNDFAGVMTDEGKAQVEDLCREVHDKTRAQIFVVTINSLEDSTIESFANDLFHNWKIGEKKTDRGILLLLAIKEHKRRIEVGYGLEPILTDGKTGDIGRDMVPALKAADYDKAVLLGVREIAQVIAADANVTLSTPVEPVAPPAEAAPVSTSSGGILGSIVAGMFFFALFGIFGVIMWINWRRGPRRFGPGGSYYGGGGPFIGGGSSDSSSSDSFSSSDSSSSSDDFSGGDGGDSGGGGSSGDW